MEFEDSINVLVNAHKVLSRYLISNSTKTKEHKAEVEAKMNDYTKAINKLKSISTDRHESEDKGFLQIDKLRGASYIIDKLNDEDKYFADQGFCDYVRLSDSKIFCKGKWISLEKVKAVKQ